MVRDPGGRVRRRVWDDGVLTSTDTFSGTGDAFLGFMAFGPNRRRRDDVRHLLLMERTAPTEIKRGCRTSPPPMSSANPLLYVGTLLRA